jgi:two-component system invasion response regulator UvrY
MSPRKLKILICDDHQLIREGLKRVLLDSGKAGDIGEASRAEEVLTAVRREEWDVAILDINLNGKSGLEVLKEIKAEFPLLPVLMLSMYPEEQYALRVFRAGANGYLNKNLATGTLLDAVAQVLTSGHYLSPKVVEQLLNAVKPPDGQPLHAMLSDREDQVLRLIGSGATVGEIAKQLGLSVKTVSTYRSIVLRKLGLENTPQLMRYVQDNGMG